MLDHKDIQPRDSQLCMIIMERQGEPLFKMQNISTSSFASKMDISSMGKMEEGPWGSAQDAAAIALCGLGEARLLAKAPISRPHTQQHSEVHAV